MKNENQKKQQTKKQNIPADCSVAKKRKKKQTTL